MNNSDLKKLIQRKGFMAAKQGGLVVMVLPAEARTAQMSKDRVSWLENLADLIEVDIPYIGYVVGDHVQIFSALPRIDEVWTYENWGKMGTITKIMDGGNLGKMAIVEVDGGLKIADMISKFSVIDRPMAVEAPAGGFTDEQILALSQGEPNAVVSD